jgi:hypothetical protein
MKQLFVGALALSIVSFVAPASHAQQFQIDPVQVQGAVQGMLMQSMFKITDADQDGKVSREEAISTAAKRFDESDSNKDGFMTKEEMQAAHQKQMHMHQQRKQMRSEGGLKMQPPSTKDSSTIHITQ